jgi:hypothetical protein
MNSAIRIGWLLVAVATLAFGLFVWPTPYEYYVHQPSETPVQMVCVNRFTGAAWVRGISSRWVPLPIAPQKE